MMVSNLLNKDDTHWSWAKPKCRILKIIKQNRADRRPRIIIFFKYIIMKHKTTKIYAILFLWIEIINVQRGKNPEPMTECSRANQKCK